MTLRNKIVIDIFVLIVLAALSAASAFIYNMVDLFFIKVCCVFLIILCIHYIWNCVIEIREFIERLRH